MSDMRATNEQHPELTVRPGEIAMQVYDAPNRTFQVRWKIPLMDEPGRSKLFHSFASDAFFYGRWAAAIPTEDDRARAQATEEGWQSECGCGRAQPCRHATTVSFRFRELAKAQPWAWLAVRGVPREEAGGQTHALRLQLIQSAMTEDAKAGESDSPIYSAAASTASPILSSAEDPPFWNRDISFADWLSHIYNSVRKEGAT
jgi:uncharacterized Zn finger protein